MKKFIKGRYKIKDEIADLDEFVNINRGRFNALIIFANNNNILFNIGETDSGERLCEYEVTASTLKECKATAAEFKKRLKTIFKRIEPIFEGNGDKIF